MSSSETLQDINLKISAILNYKKGLNRLSSWIPTKHFSSVASVIFMSHSPSKYFQIIGSIWTSCQREFRFFFGILLIIVNISSSKTSIFADTSAPSLNSVPEFWDTLKFSTSSCQSSVFVNNFNELMEKWIALRRSIQVSSKITPWMLTDQTSQKLNVKIIVM